MTDSQVEHLLNDIAESPAIMQDITNSPVTVSSTNTANTNYHFHGCVVKIYNK